MFIMFFDLVICINEPVYNKLFLTESLRPSYLFVCLFQWTPSFKEGEEYPLGWDLTHILRPNRPLYHFWVPEVG